MGDELRRVVVMFPEQRVIVRDATVRVLLALRGCMRMPMPDMYLRERCWGGRAADPWGECWESQLLKMERSQ